MTRISILFLLTLFSVSTLSFNIRPAVDEFEELETTICAYRIIGTLQAYKLVTFDYILPKCPKPSSNPAYLPSEEAWAAHTASHEATPHSNASNSHSKIKVDYDDCIIPDHTTNRRPGG